MATPVLTPAPSKKTRSPTGLKKSFKPVNRENVLVGEIVLVHFGLNILKLGMARISKLPDIRPSKKPDTG